MLDLYINIKNAYFALESALRISITNSHQYNTPGFKYSFPVFSTIFEKTLSSGTATQNPLHLGSSLTLGAVTRDFSQGKLVAGTQLDAGISGEGLFVLGDVSQAQFTGAVSYVYSRNGRFRIQNGTNYLVDMFGRVAMGYKVDETGNTGTQLEPIVLKDAVDLGILDGGLVVNNFSVASSTSGAKAEPLYRLAMTTFHNKQGLGSSDGSSFVETAASGKNTGFGYASTKIKGTKATYGKIIGGQYESSNVDIARINLDLNVLNRGTSAVQGVMDDLGKTLTGFLSKM
eukprot:COSAG01_NODE_6_length_54687_cov_500.907599_5_plen_287_part_00